MSSSFEWAYAGTPPWDIGRPQREVVALAEGGAFRGRVLDAGCGTGEHALYLAGRGLDVLGIDESPTAIARARKKAADRGIEASFVVADALDLARVGRTFDTVLDCGLFHTFTNEERDSYAASLAATVPPGGTCYLLCFSDLQPGAAGPRRVTRDEIGSTFDDGWRIDEIRPATFETLLPEGDIRAWLAVLARFGD